MSPDGRPILGADERTLEAGRLFRVRLPLLETSPAEVGLVIAAYGVDGSVPELSWSWLLFELAQVVGEAMLGLAASRRHRSRRTTQFFEK